MLVQFECRKACIPRSRTGDAECSVAETSSGARQHEISTSRRAESFTSGNDCHFRFRPRCCRRRDDVDVPAGQLRSASPSRPPLYTEFVGPQVDARVELRCGRPRDSWSRWRRLSGRLFHSSIVLRFMVSQSEFAL